MRLLSISEIQSMQLELMKKLHTFLEDNSISYYLIAGSALGAVRHNGFIPWDDDIDVAMFRNDYEKFLSIATTFSKDYHIVNYRNSKNCDFGLTRIYFSQTYIDDCSIENTCLDKRLYLDIFPLDNVPDNPKEQNRYEKRIRRIKKIISKIDVRNYDNGKYILIAKRILSFFLRPTRQYWLKSFDRMMCKYKNMETLSVCSLCSQYSFKKQSMSKKIYGTPTLQRFEDSKFYFPEKLEEYLITLYGDNYMEIPPVEKRRKGHNIYLISEE